MAVRLGGRCQPAQYAAQLQCGAQRGGCPSALPLSATPAYVSSPLTRSAILPATAASIAAYCHNESSPPRACSPRSSKIRCAVPRDSGMGCVIVHGQAPNSRSLFNDCAYGSPDVAHIEHGESPATPDAKVLPAEGLSNHVNGRLHARRPQILKPVDREVVPAFAKQKRWAVSGRPERCLACNIWARERRWEGCLRSFA